MCSETAPNTLLAVQGIGLAVTSAAQPKTSTITVTLHLPANGARDFIVKLPSPVVPLKDREQFLALNYAASRVTTVKFWNDYLAKGAYFDVPEDAVNTLFRANLWHALRLPRRHGVAWPDVRIDLPYSNFAYDQTGTPWPVNQAVYVDFMLYDLRGYHAISAEELAIQYRNNQELNGHVGGLANWGVYTPGMLYSVARHYLLSGDRDSFEKLLPQTLALDWCLGQMKRATDPQRPAPGLVRAPLNDLSHDSARGLSTRLTSSPASNCWAARSPQSTTLAPPSAAPPGNLCGLPSSASSPAPASDHPPCNLATAPGPPTCRAMPKGRAGCSKLGIPPTWIRARSISRG